MQHYKPHAGAKFNGYYSKFHLPSGSYVVLIVSSVHDAAKDPHKVSLIYYPHNTNDGTKVYRSQTSAKELRMFSETKDEVAFELRFNQGCVTCYNDSTTEYRVENDSFKFTARTKPEMRTPWMDDMDTPEGMLVYLPLPLHWHVQSLSVQSDFTLEISGYDVLDEDKSGSATVHQEMNWAAGFPTGHNWMQARDEEKDCGICLAGGQIIGLEAFLVGYRASNPRYSMAFRPPLAVKAAGYSPTLSVASSWKDKTFELSVQSWTRKLVVKAQAPQGSFFGLSAPFSDGHRRNALAQSFRTKIVVQVYEAGWLSAWELVHEDVFENGSLEYGASYYPPAGTTSEHH